MSAYSTKRYKSSILDDDDDNNKKRVKIMQQFKILNDEQFMGPRLTKEQMHVIRGRVLNCLNHNIPVPSWDVIYSDIVNNSYTTDCSFEIRGLQHDAGQPDIYDVSWENTKENKRNINVDEMTEEQFINLFPKTEDTKKLREEFQSLLKLKNKFK